MSVTRKYYIICEVSEIEVTQEQFNNYIEDLKRHQEIIGQKVWYETDDFKMLTYFYCMNGNPKP